MIYLDSSALVKLALAEPESATLIRWLAERADMPMVSSIIHRAEVARAVWRASPDKLARSYWQMRRVEIVPLSRSVAEAAGALTPPALRSLDAIHLASALILADDLAAFVTYDKRLLVAAREAGLPVASPV